MGQLSRDIYVYHWYDKDKMYLKGFSKPLDLLKWYLEGWEKWITNDVGEFGIGLYAAYDPEDSSEFGDHLARIRLAAGTSFLDVRTQDVGDYQDEIPVSRRTLYLMRTENCNLTLSGTQGVIKTHFSQTKACNDILVHTIRSLNIEFFVYKWTAGSGSFLICDPKGDENLDLAFLLTNYEVNEDNVTFLSSMDREVEKLKNRSLYKDKTFGCNKSVYTEDRQRYADLNPTITITKASFGTNIDSSLEGNVTDKAAAFCNGRAACTYKVSPKFIGDPAPDQEKSFEIFWKCSDSDKEYSFKKEAPSTNTIQRLECTE